MTGMFYAAIDDGYIAMPAADIQVAEGRLYKVFGAYKKDFVVYDRLELVDAGRRAKFFGSLADYTKRCDELTHSNCVDK